MQRVVENLNASIHLWMERQSDAYFIGEDILDPYGGAFKVSRGLSETFSDRVLTTPISEQCIVGVANGLALAGHSVIAEMMFGDFAFLAFDQIVNFAAKSVSMYGDRCSHRLLVRCPVGARRGYGATHSQTVQKHFIGVPNLDLYELSPLHDTTERLPRIFENGCPAMLFESKALLADAMYEGGKVDNLFSYEFCADDSDVAVVSIDDADAQPNGPLIITGGGCFDIALKAARELFLEEEIESTIAVPWKLFPVPSHSLGRLAHAASAVVIVEESTAGGTWGAEVAQMLLCADDPVKAPCRLVHSENSVIPSSKHLEDAMLVKPSQVCKAVVSLLNHA